MPGLAGKLPTVGFIKAAQLLMIEGAMTEEKGDNGFSEDSEAQKPRMPQFLPKLKGQQVMIRMNDGRPLAGKLVSFNAYEVVLDAGPRTYLLFKHSIASIDVPKGLID